jgi:hypothetical protein
MANLKGVQATNANHLPVPSADKATDLIPIVGDYVLVAGNASGDIVEMCPLPAGYVPVDVIVDAEDGGTTVTTDVGIMSGNWGDSGVRTQGAEFMTGKALGTAGIYRADVVGFSRIAPTTNNRSIGMKFTTVSAPTAGAKVRMTVLARPQVEGV